jgi:serine protease Do
VLTVFSLLIDARTIRAVTHDGIYYEADVVDRDADRQLALLRLKPPGDENAVESSDEAAGPFPFFDLAREAALSPGDWVLAAGNPFKVASGAEPVSIAHGVFSTRTKLDARRRVQDFPYRGDVLAIDAVTSNPGAPGSALVNIDGEFVGMIGRVVTSNLTHTHFNYAIPRDVLHEYVQSAMTAEAGEAPDEAAASKQKNFDPGIRVARTGYKTVLPFVERVQRGSPAKRAGVRPDDLILSINGRAIPDVEAYEKRMASLRPDEPIELVIRRDREILSIRIDSEEP